jgi:metal-responsive CopG/Arc/MetJ family transcriptional regulator
MPYRKTAIAIPEDVLADVDSAAKEHGWSRSRFITEVLRRATRARRDAEVTRRLNELFADESLREQQRRDADQLAEAAAAWEDELW